MNANQSRPWKTAGGIMFGLGSTLLLIGCETPSAPPPIHVVGQPVEEPQEQLVFKPSVPENTEPPTLQPSAVQSEATDALARIGEPALPALIATLSAPEPLARAEAARALSTMGPAAATAVPTLIQLLHDADPEVRANAARALGQIGPAAQEAVPELIDLLKRPDTPPVTVPAAPPAESPVPVLAPEE